MSHVKYRISRPISGGRRGAAVSAAPALMTITLNQASSSALFRAHIVHMYEGNLVGSSNSCLVMTDLPLGGGSTTQTGNTYNYVCRELGMELDLGEISGGQYVIDKGPISKKQCVSDNKQPPIL